MSADNGPGGRIAVGVSNDVYRRHLWQGHAGPSRTDAGDCPGRRVAGLVVAAAAAALIRRRPAWIGALPSGRPDPLFHPPQFS